MELLTQVFTEAGFVALLLLLALGAIGYAIKVSIPLHFTLIREMNIEHDKKSEKTQLRFASSLSEVTKEHKQVTAGLLRQFEKQGEDHSKIIEVLSAQTRILNKVDMTQDLIHNKLS